MNHHQNLITNYGMQSPRFFVTETDSRFNHQKQLTVTEAGRAVKVETDLPHLVSLGSGRFSTAVTLHPLPEGKTTVGCMNADIIIRGRGIHPEHCYFIHERDVVVLFPISQLITVDGAKVTRPTILSQGSMICFGRSSYFRFNHPAEAQHLKEEHFDIYSETYSTAGMFSKREPLYANEEMSTSSATSTTEGSASIPLYDNVAEIRSSRDRKIDDPHGTPSDTLTPLSPEPDRGSLHGTRSPFFPSFAAFPDGSRRPADGGFRGNEFVVNVATSDLFDEKASHIPRPLSPFECVTSCTWSGYDNVLELKESMRRLETKEERRGEDDDPRSAIRDCQPPPGSALPLIRCTDRFSPVTVGVFIGEVVNSSSNKNNNKNIDNDKNNNKSNNFDEDNNNNNNVNNNNISNNNINSNSSSSSMDRVLAIKKQFSEPVDKRKVTFSIKDEVDTHPSDDSFSNDVVSKPPSGKLSIEQHKRQDSKRDQHKRQDSKRDRVKLTWGKRDAIASAENEIPPAKSSFFKNLMRSRSPSPSKRSPSPTPFLNSDVAKRLSEPLKKSFKNHDQSLRDKFFGTTLSHRDDSSSDDESTDSKSSAQIPSNSSQTTKSSDNSIVTHDWSSQRIESTINTTDDEKSNPRLLVKHQLQLQQQQQQQPVNCNPWKFSLKSSDLNVNFDSYKGEKLFSRDTVTTSVCFSGVHNEQNSRAGGDETDVQPGPKRDVANPIYDSVYEDVRATDGELHLRSVNNSPVPVDRRADVEENPSEESDRHVGSVSKHGKVSGHFASNDTKPPQKLEKSPAECSTGSGISPPKKCAHHVTLGDQRGSEDGSKHEQSSASSNTPSIALSSTLTFRSDVQNDSPLISNLNKPQLPHESAQNSAHAELPSTRIPSVGGDLTFLASSSAQMSSDSRRDDDCVSPPKGSNDVTAGKPSMFEGTSGQQVDGVAALFGLRRGVLGRMKMLKQKIEEIEEKERNIENLITRDSMSIDVLEKKKISEKDIKDFFTNATNVLDSLEEEGKKVELQFVEANEYLNRINKTILEMERKKKTQHTSTLSNTVNNNSNNINTDSGCSRADHNGEITCSPSPWNSSNLPKASDTGNPLTSQDAKISSGSSDNSSIFGSFSLLERSTKKSKASSAGSLTLSEKGTPLGMPRNSTCRPLTRYFPVTDSSFDLKCYIESSGHNLDMCKTVFVESYKCFGYLSKMGRKWKKWHRRWFIFDRTKRHLACYLNEPAHQQQQPRSSYYFQSIRDVFADHLHMVKSPNPDFTFCVKLVSKNLFLMASSADAMRIWIDVLFTGAEAYQDVS